MNNIYIGTSGWNYKHWVRLFYPEELPAREWLGYYCRHFSTVEINNSFYHLPSTETFKKWYKESPDSFIFSVKASRFITHMKKLKGTEEATNNFLTNASYLKEKLGPILFQLPPYWKVNAERLVSFIDLLPKRRKYVFEFRDPSWFNDEVFNVLNSKNVAFCVHDMIRSGCPRVATGSFAYIRFHGTTSKYRGKYSQDQLAEWLSFIKECQRGSDVYVYFNNDQNCFAVENARELDEMCA